MSEIRFLITYDAFSNDLYIPINRIQYIQTGFEHNRYFIHIKMINEKDGYEERFDNEQDMEIRMDKIRSILGAR